MKKIYFLLLMVCGLATFATAQSTADLVGDYALDGSSWKPPMRT